MQIDTKQNERYFSGAAMGWISKICAIVAIVCAALLFLRIWWLYWIVGPIGIIAVIVAIVASTRSVSDREYDGVCNDLEKAFRTRYMDYVNNELNRNNGRGKAPVAVPEDRICYSRSFLYGEGMRLRIGQDTRRRTDRISFTAYLLERNRVLIGSQSVGLVDGTQEELFRTVLFENVAQVEAFRPEGLHEFAEYSRVRITLKVGDPVEFWRANDAELDELISVLRAHISDSPAE